MILKSLGIELEPVDITAPGMDEARDFMRANGKKKENERNVLPPQIFNGEKYCGVRNGHFFLDKKPSCVLLRLKICSM